MNIVSTNTLKNFGYPDVVLEIISRFLDAVTDVYKGNEIGVLLVGSTSRGELCWSVLEDKITLYSDIEFLIAVDSNNNHIESMLSKRVESFTKLYDLGERFHIDYVVNKWSNLKRLQKKIFIFDSKSNGLDLTEFSVKNHLPEVKKSNLDFKELNDVLLHRMKAVINDIPQDGVIGRSSHNSFILSIAKDRKSVV